MFTNSNKKLFLINKKFFNNISRNLKTNKSNKLAAISHVNPWKKVKDPHGSNSYYYWNTVTNETTPLGHIYHNRSPKPYYWIEVEEPLQSGKTYWWNPETNETTAIGAFKPDRYDNKSIIIDNNNINKSIQSTTNHSINRNPFLSNHHSIQKTSFVGSMMTYMTLGVGMTLGMIVVKTIFGM